MTKHKIVLIEDEEDIADLITLQADMFGYRCLHAADGLNGFDLAAKEKPDVVILDLMLPGQNGLDVCRKMKADSRLKQVPIIMISAKSEETDVVLGLELGADDYVTKPFSPRVLFSRVKAVLRRHDAQDEATPQVSFGEF
ncbi:MAG TPA: response regulator, partial [Chlamydiales bacterium]|nr:response regulator [Chlamydiales bacterium]